MSRRLSWSSLSFVVFAVNLTLAHQHLYADEWEKFKSKYGNNFIARWDAKTGTPRLVHGQGIPLGNTHLLTDANIAELAYNFISTNKELFQVNLANLQLKSVKRIQDNWSVKFQQYHNGIPVEGAVIGISITDHGFINLIGSGYYPGINILANVIIDSTNAISIAKNQYSKPSKVELSKVSIVILPIEEISKFKFYLAWKIELLYYDNSPSKVFFVDASSGSILKQINLFYRTGITGNVRGKVWFTPPQNGVIPPPTEVPYPHLIVKLYGTQYQGITDSNGNYILSQGQAGVDQVRATFENENIKIQVDPDAGSGYTIEEHLSTATSWTWTDIDNHGGEYNVFYWLNFMHEYFSNNFNHDIWGSQQVVANMYSPMPTQAGGNMIWFDASPYRQRDKGTICHEYAHNLQSEINIPTGPDGGSFWEGTAYYYAASVHNDPELGGLYPLNSSSTPYYYEDYVPANGPYYNGAIIGKAMWTFRTQMGNAILADGLILEAFNILSNFPQNQGPNGADLYKDFVTTILIADDTDADPVNGTPNQAIILNSFGIHHIYPGGYIVSGNITGETIWNTGTYITGNVMVISGARLTIGGGAIVTMDNGTSFTVNGTLNISRGATLRFAPGIVLDIYGSLYCGGGLQSNPPAVFDRLGNTGAWYGIKLRSAAKIGSSIAWATIDHAQKGIHVINNSKNLNISNCTIRNFTEQGVYIDRSTVTVQNCTIENTSGGSHGIQTVGSTGNPSILNNEVSGGAVGIGRATAGGPAFISGNNIHDCTKGVQTTEAAPEIVNNIITDCSHGIYLATGSSANIHDNDIYSNSYGVNIAQSQPSQLKWNLIGAVLATNSTGNVFVQYLTAGNTFLDYRSNNFYGDDSPGIKNLTSVTLNARGNYNWYDLWYSGPIDLSSPLSSPNPDAGTGGQTGKSAQPEETPAPSLPKNFFLTESYPNPFSLSGGANYVRFDLPERATVGLAIYDLQGKLVRSLASSQNFEGGRLELVWDGKDGDGRVVSSGIYFYRLQAVGVSSGKRFADARKLTVVR